MSNAYEVIMDEDKNPLRPLPKAQRFQLMAILATMWSTIFCVAVGSFLWWGELVVGHVAVVMGIFMTGMTFRMVKNQHRNSNIGHSE